MLTPYQEALEAAQGWCDKLPPDARVLDAGSGLRSYVHFPPGVHVTGVDISQELLDRNPRLDERILADLQTWEPTGTYDCVVCWEVLEHLQDPFPVIRRLADAVAGEGLLIIGSPNPGSVKGLVTRFTPHRFHQWLYRRFFDGEQGPYPTFMKATGGASVVNTIAGWAGLTNVYTAMVESPMQLELRQRFRVTGPAWATVRLLVRVLSLGMVRADATDYISVFTRVSGRTTPTTPTATSFPPEASLL